VYVSNNPLKYVDPSGHDSTWGYNKDVYSNYAFSSFMPKEIKDFQEQVEEAENATNIVVFCENPYAEQKSIFEHIEGLYKAFDEDAARATDDFCTGFFYGLGRYLSLGLYNDSEAENIRYEEAFAEGVGFVEAMLIYPYIVSALSNVVIKESYTPYYGNDSQSTQLIPADTKGAISTTSGYNVIQMPPEYAVTVTGINWVKSGTPSVAKPNHGQGFSSKGYNPKPGERTLDGYVRNNANPEISLTTQSPGFNNNNGNVGGVFKRFGAESHGGVSPHVHQPQRNVAPNGSVYGSVGTKTSNGGVTSPSLKDVKQLYEYLNNGKYQ